MAVLVAGAAFADVPAANSSDSLKTLSVRIAADEASVQQLERKLGNSENQAGVIRVADLFGESDEEKAARLQKEKDQDQNIATLNERVNDLEQTLTKLTGQMEELDHRVSEFNAKIDRMQKDYDYKLCAVVAQQMGTSTAPGDQNALPCPGQVAPAATTAPAPGNPAPTSNGEGGPVHLAPPPGVLGTLPQGTQLPQAGEASQASAEAAPNGDAHVKYEAAMTLLSKAQYSEAAAAFRNFADTYPKDDSAPLAIYWIGAIAFVQKDYQTASQRFAEELKKYPNNPRAPDSMLKLGQSLIAMNEKKEGCTFLAALPKNASPTVKAQAVAARKAAACH